MADEPKPETPAPKTYTEADIAGLKSKNQELLDSISQLKGRTAILGDRTPDEIKADLELAKQVREKKAKDEGDFETLKKQLVDQHTATTTKLQGKLFDVLGRSEAERAITAAGGVPKVLLPHVLQSVKVVEKDGDFVPVVVDAAGKPRLAGDGSGNPMSIAQLVESIKSDEAFAGAFAASGAAGSGARNGGGPGGGTGTVIIPKDATPDQYRRMKAEAEKAGRPYAVAS